MPSSSGVHMGHYKASMENEDIAEIHSMFLTLPFLFVFSLSRWKQSLHVILQELNKPNIHKLCIIQLFGADFNAVLTIYYLRRMIESSERFILNPEQVYGGRRGIMIHNCLAHLQLLHEQFQSVRSPCQ